MEKKYGKKQPKKATNDGKDWSMSLTNVINVMTDRGINANPIIVGRIFGSGNKNLKTCTVKQLRHRLAHNMTDYVLKAIIDRADEINADLDSYFGVV